MTEQTISPEMEAQAAEAVLTTSDDRLVFQGSAVKALGDGKVGGYLVLFGDPDSADLDGEFFTAETDFDIPTGGTKSTSIYYHHGLDPVLKKRKLGSGEIGTDDTGVWLRGQLNMRDAYEQAVYKLVELGKMGWSSGTMPHLIEREPVGKATHIKSWPLGGDASLTVTPADPRQHAIPLKAADVVPLKSLVAVKVGPEPGAAPEASTTDAAQAAEAMTGAELNAAVKAAVHAALDERPEPTQTENKIMPEEITQVTPAQAEPVNPVPAATVKSTDGSAAELEAVKAQLAQLTSTLAALTAPVEKTKLNVPAIKRVTELGFADDHVKGFIHYVRTGDRGAVDAALKANVNPLESATDAQGAVLVPDDFFPQIVAKRDEASIMRRAGAQVITTSLDVVNVPAENGSATYFDLTAQEEGVDEDEPTFANVPITVYTYTKLMKISNQLLSDEKANLIPFLTGSAARAWAMTENKAFLTGAGTTLPQGVFVGGTKGLDLDAAAAIGAAEIPELVGKLDGPYRDRAIWIMNRTTDAYLRALSGNQRWFEQTPSGEAGIRGNGGTLEGYPVFLSNEAAAIGASAKSLLFGNVEAGYAIAEHGNMALIRLNELYAGNLQTGLLWVIRVGGAVVNAEALQYAAHPSA